MNGKLKKVLSTACLAAALAAGFQNCDNSQSHIPVSALSKANFFNYPYTSPPTFYGEISLFKPKGAVENLNQFKFVGTVTLATDPAPIDYEVRVQTLQGVTMCPAQSGRLDKGLSTVMFDCSSLIKADQARVTFKVTSGAKTHTFEKLF